MASLAVSVSRLIQPRSHTGFGSHGPGVDSAHPEGARRAPGLGECGPLVGPGTAFAARPARTLGIDHGSRHAASTPATLERNDGDVGLA